MIGFIKRMLVALMAPEPTPNCPRCQHPMTKFADGGWYCEAGIQTAPSTRTMQ